VRAGTYAEYILPLLIIIGFLTRLAAIGMIGFVVVQSIVDITGHGVGGADLGAWFDKASGALIMDQRTLWVFVLLVLVVRGAGPFSVDRLLKRTVV
jgi:putative oxidoreductase